MRFKHACIESLATALPDENWTSAAIEERLRPLYDRLKLPAGRLELMTGIKERRVAAPDEATSDMASEAARRAMADAGVKPEDIQLKQGAGFVDLPSVVDEMAADGLEGQLEHIQREAIIRALEQTRYNKTKAAELLGMTFRQLRYRVKKLGIE